MRKTLVQALGAAFCAILCALSGMGGGGMMIGARTAAWAGTKLPYLRRVAYLESNKNQRIDTLIKRDVINDYRMIIDISYANTSERQLNGVQGFMYVGVVSGHFQIALGASDYRPDVAIPNQRYLIDLLFSNQQRIVEYTINGGSKRRYVAGYENTPPNANFNLFSLNDLVLPSACKIFGFSLYENYSLVRDLIPVLDLSGRPAMYDEVSEQLFYNQGTGGFTWGELDAS